MCTSLQYVLSRITFEVCQEMSSCTRKHGIYWLGNWANVELAISCSRHVLTGVKVFGYTFFPYKFVSTEVCLGIHIFSPMKYIKDFRVF